MLSHVPLFCDTIDCSPPGFSVHGISQVRILEWVTVSLFRASSGIMDQICISYTGRLILDPWATREAFISHSVQFSSVQFSRSVMFDSLRPHELQLARRPCPSPTPGVHPNSCPSRQWRHPAISSSVVLFSSCPQSFSASESFPVSQLFALGGQRTGVSALVIRFYANFDFFFDFFYDLLLIQQRVVQPPYVGIFNSFSLVIEI